MNNKNIPTLKKKSKLRNILIGIIGVFIVVVLIEINFQVSKKSSYLVNASMFNQIGLNNLNFENLFNQNKDDNLILVTYQENSKASEIRKFENSIFPKLQITIPSDWGVNEINDSMSDKIDYSINLNKEKMKLSIRAISDNEMNNIGYTCFKNSYLNEIGGNWKKEINNGNSQFFTNKSYLKEGDENFELSHKKYLSLNQNKDELLLTQEQAEICRSTQGYNYSTAKINEMEHIITFTISSNYSDLNENEIGEIENIIKNLKI
jgi:hypothetical protein